MTFTYKNHKIKGLKFHKIDKNRWTNKVWWKSAAPSMARRARGNLQVGVCLKYLGVCLNIWEIVQNIWDFVEDIWEFVLKYTGVCLRYLGLRLVC